MIAAVVLVSLGFVLWARLRPGYDAYGWLVWGRQTLHGHLNTDGAPSWKPLTYLFTLPYALAGNGAVALWMLTAVGGALSGCVFAARIAYRLSGPSPTRRWAPRIAAAFAAGGLLGLDGYWQLILIANSDPLIVSLCLAAIDSQLSRRPRLAFVLLVLAALGRPEVWLFAGLQALWLWRAVARPRGALMIMAGLAVIPLLWFSVPALTSASWLRPGELAFSAGTVIHGSKLTGVLIRFVGLTQLQFQLAAALALGLAAARRDRATLLLGAATLGWVALEIGFALHGWSAAPRYLVEPAALVVVLAGAGVGRLLAGAAPAPRFIRRAGALAAAGLVMSLIPLAQQSESFGRAELVAARISSTRIERLEAVVARAGGAARILACGQPVSLVGEQSTLAYYVDLNVGNVGYRPGKAIASGRPIVVFKPHRLGWEIRPNHPRAADRRDCESLRTDTAFGP